VLTSLDAKPISPSARLLLCVTAKEANTSRGPPAVIEPVTGRIVLRSLENAALVELSLLDGSGRPSGNSLVISAIDNKWELDFRAVTTWYLISVRRLIEIPIHFLTFLYRAFADRLACYPSI